MAEKVSAYKCDWCHRCFGRLCDANRHETACSNNPARRHCKTCVHGIMGLDHISTGLDGKEVEVRRPWCAKHDKPMHEKPYYIDCDYGGGFDTGFGYHDEFPLPGTCEYYEYKGKAEWTKEARHEE